MTMATLKRLTADKEPLLVAIAEKEAERKASEAGQPLPPRSVERMAWDVWSYEHPTKTPPPNRPRPSFDEVNGYPDPRTER